MALWFVYRSHYSGAARDAGDVSELAKDALGCHVYGFDSVLAAVKEHRLDPPGSIDEMRELLDEHLYVEGEFILDEHSLRVATDDDEVALAYFIFDDVAAARADRVAWLLHDEAALPAGGGDGEFAPPVEASPIEPRGQGAGRTWACLLTFSDGDSLPGAAHVFDGVRLPDLLAHLAAVEPVWQQATWSKEYVETWPLQLRLLRASGGATLAEALARAGQSPLSSLTNDQTNTSRLGLGDAASAAREFAGLAAKLQHAGEPTQNIVAVSDHAAILCVHAHKFFGYQQWIFFDDRWAAAHPALASSLLRYASDWDPFSDE